MWRYVNLTLEVSAGDIIIWAHTGSAVTYIGRVTDVDVLVGSPSHPESWFNVADMHYRVIKLQGSSLISTWDASIEVGPGLTNATIIAHRHIIEVLGNDDEVLANYLRNWGRKTNQHS